MAQINAGLAEVARYRLKEQGGDPANPAAGFQYLYCKANGLYIKLNDGTVLGPFAASPERYYTFSVLSILTVAGGVIRIYNLTGAALTINEVHIAVNTAPTGAAILVDVHENGVTIFTVQGNRPTIAIAAFTGNTVVIDAPTWENDNYLTVDVDQIGSVIAGSNLTVTVVAS